MFLCVDRRYHSVSLSYIFGGLYPAVLFIIPRCVFMMLYFMTCTLFLISYVMISRIYDDLLSHFILINFYFLS